MRAPVSFAMARHCSTSPLPARRISAQRGGYPSPSWPHRPSASCPCCCARRRDRQSSAQAGFCTGVFQHGHQIGENLRWVELVGQAVPHRHPAYSPSSSTMAAVAAIFDAVIHAAQHAGGVFHRLFMANLRAAWAEIGDLRAGRTRPLRRRSGCGWRFSKIRAMFFPTGFASRARLLAALSSMARSIRYWISAGV